jgi:hypothetical protein
LAVGLAAAEALGLVEADDAGKVVVVVDVVGVAADDAVGCCEPPGTVVLPVVTAGLPLQPVRAMVAAIAIAGIRV